MEKTFSTTESKKIVAKLGSKLSAKGIEQFRKGLKVESEHGSEGSREYGVNTNVTKDDPVKTGKIALVHIAEDPGYYDALEKMEDEDERKEHKKAIIKKHLTK